MVANKIDIITLGCSKNLVDSERLIKQLELNGFEVAHDAETLTGEIAVVNTCGFIGDAKEESINMILELCERKKSGQLGKLFVMGCLSERYLNELSNEIPEVDGYFGKFNWNELLDVLGKTYHTDKSRSRRITTPSHYAYLKISEGCDRRCAYCAIPIITGKHVSRPIEDILDEVRELVACGVKEFQMIAQELTYYGLDLYKERRIAQLVSDIADIPGVKWLRLHYAYPTQFPMELLDVMREKQNVCKYLDIALQHISDSVLSSMHRNVTAKETYDLITTIREKVPGIHLRTTLMVGHPGETDDDFEQLIEFVKWAKFERMGAFAYSEEEGTYSGDNYEDDVPDDVKQNRLSKLMRIQQRISSEIQERKKGCVLPVIIDRIEGEYYVGRTEYDSPDVDPEVLISCHDNQNVVIGEFYNAQIDSSDDFDLYAHIVE
mgnify:FL=1